MKITTVKKTGGITQTETILNENQGLQANQENGVLKITVAAKIGLFVITLTQSEMEVISAALKSY